MTNHGGAVAVLAGIVLITTGCSDSNEEPSGLATSDPPAAATSASAPDESESATTPTPTVPPALAKLRNMELPSGMVIENIPEVESSQLAALDTFVRFHAARWQSLLDSEVSPELSEVASEEVVQGVADQVDVQVNEGFHLGGTVRFDLMVEGANDNAAVVAACFDQSEVTVVRGDTEEIGEDAANNPVGKLIADVTNTGTGWIVTNSRVELDEC